MAAPRPIIKQHATHLEGWIQSCNENHGDDCQVLPIDARPPHHIPDWVIDTEDGCIVPGCGVQRYVALSYVWSSTAKDDGGKGPAIQDRLMLQTDNLDDFCRPNFLRNHILGRVPTVIRDAIDFVQISGYRYLWVDSLCIVQHDDTTRDRVGLMNEVYSGAYLTIIAAASTEGLYGKGDYGNGPPTVPPENNSARHLHNKLLCSHWASRGWTFQEQLLSKRSIVFLDDVCFWDCQREVQWPRLSIKEDTDSSVQSYFLPQVRRSIASSRSPFEEAFLGRVARKAFDKEVLDKCALKRKVLDKEILTLEARVRKVDSSVVDKKVLQRKDLERKFLERKRFERKLLDKRLLERELLSVIENPNLASLSPIPDFKFYMELVCRYSNRNLTYDQDVLPAFSGVLEAFSRRNFPGGFISGLPALFLDSALLWQPLLKARRRSPVRTAAEFAPIAPLPSWSWAGWQCLVDPASLKGGLDYMAGAFQFSRASTMPESWRTWKLVDWYVLSRDGSVSPVHEPAMLQNFKDCWDAPDQMSLPTEWSRNATGNLFHASNPRIYYRYPLPTQNACSTTAADRDAHFLSCTTTTAAFRIRRVLVPYGTLDVSSRQQPQGMQHSSIFETDLYNFSPQLHDLCPVITLEDKNGRWAGAMAIMEDKSPVKPGSEIKMVAISTGIAFVSDVTKAYPEMIDSRGYWSYASSLDEYHFRPLDCCDGLDNGGGSGSGRVSAAVDTLQSLKDNVDVGPIAYRCWERHIHNPSHAAMPNAPAYFHPLEPYHFYNILWVELIDGVMYRKAAGRVPKEIWELNCGEPTKIVLG